MPHYYFGCQQLSKHSILPFHLFLLGFYNSFYFHSLFLDFNYVLRNSEGHSRMPPWRSHEIKGLKGHRRFCPCRVLCPKSLLVSTYRPIKGSLLGVYHKQRYYLPRPIPPQRSPVNRSCKYLFMSLFILKFFL